MVMVNHAPIVAITALALVVPCVAQAQSPPRRLMIGANMTFDVSDGRVESERIGVQLHVPIVRSVEFVPQLTHFVSKPAWQAVMTARVRPRLLGSLFSVGAGIQFTHFQWGNGASGCNSCSRMETLAVIAVGVSQWWSVGPFGEVHFVDILGGLAGADVVLGMKLRV